MLALGADEVDFSQFDGALKVYIGHHGDKGAHAADIILPAAAYTEKAGTYVNTEGRVQFADKAVFAPGDAREDWTILRALADALGVSVGFDSFAELRAAMIAEVPALGTEGLADYGSKLPKGKKSGSGKIGYPIKDFYLTNPIARASATMQRCSAELLHGEDIRGGSGMTAFFQSLGMPYDWAWFIATICGILLIALPLMLAVAMIIYSRPQDLGGDGAAARAQRGRAVRPAAIVRRRAQGVPAGNHHPERGEQGHVPDRADRHLHRGADGLGGDPVQFGRGAGGHQCRPALHSRDQLAGRFTASS